MARDAVQGWQRTEISLTAVLKAVAKGSRSLAMLQILSTKEKLLLKHQNFRLEIRD